MPQQATVKVMSADDVSHGIIKAAMKVHSVLGPGLLENAYQVCLAHEVRKAGFKVETEVGLPVVYDGTKLEHGATGAPIAPIP